MLHAYLVMACKSTESMTVLRSVVKGNGREAWSKLQKYYEDGSMFTKINLQIQMFNHTLQAKGHGLQTPTYLHEFAEFRRKLLDQEIKFDDSTIVALVLNGLPSGFKQLCTILCTVVLSTVHICAQHYAQLCTALCTILHKSWMEIRPQKGIGILIKF